MDGTSSTFFSFENNYGVCSRNLEVKDGENVYWKLSRKYHLGEVLPTGFAVQGEICGPNIQKNRLQLTEYDLFVFNVYDICNRKYLDYEEFIRFTTAMGLKRVPVLTDNFIFDSRVHTVDFLLEMAKGKYIGTTNDREGIVIRPVIETYSNVLKGRLSFKVLNNDALLLED
jgi:hypothetical protein